MGNAYRPVKFEIGDVVRVFGELQTGIIEDIEHGNEDWLIVKYHDGTVYELDPSETNLVVRPRTARKWTPYCNLAPSQFGDLTVQFWWVGPKPLDRPHTFSIGVANENNVARLFTAVEDGAVFSNCRIKTDTAGKTYVEADRNIFGKRLNADLKRIGY